MITCYWVLFENVDSEETQQLENTIDDELSLEDISLEDALTNRRRIMNRQKSNKRKKATIQ